MLSIIVNEASSHLDWPSALAISCGRVVFEQLIDPVDYGTKEPDNRRRQIQSINTKTTPTL